MKERGLQQQFFELIRRPLNAQDRMVLDRKGADWVDAEIKPNDRLSADERLEIYARQYWFRILESLYDDFPGLRALMGNSGFEDLIRRYIERYPSQSYTLRNFGNRLPDFILKQKTRYRSRAKLYFQMANLELAQLHVFDVRNEVVLTAKQLGLRPLRCRLRLAPHLRLMKLDYALDVLQVELNQLGLKEQLSNGVLDRQLRGRCRSLVGRLKKEEIYLGVHRHQFKVYFKRLAPWAYALLLEIDQGIPLGKAIENVTSQRKYKKAVTADQIQFLFQEWSALGWLEVKNLV